MPEKFHGLTDQEIKYRKRYLDLICNNETWETFNDRFKIIKSIRKFFDDKGYIEVETPMMHKIPGGATARPFMTHHNTLDIDLFMRIAPELYLKKLIVGGFEKIYEINRNFRNEGVSSKHNPEFTMIEFYQTYANYLDMMDLTEELLKNVVNSVKNTLTITYQGQNLDFDKPFERMTLKESIVKSTSDINLKDINDKKSKLFIDFHNYDGSSLHSEYINSNDLNVNNFEIVETINITDFCLENKIKEIDILKIDAEGSEYDILYSLNNSITKISVIYCESHNSKNYLKINNLLEKSHKIIRDYKKNNDLFETIYVHKKYYE